MLLKRVILGSMLFGAVAVYAALESSIVAYVNNEPITSGEIQRELELSFAFSQRSSEDQAILMQRHYRQILDLLIDRRLILDAFAKSNAQLPPDALDRHIQSIISRDFNGDRSELTDLLRKYKMTYDAWKKETSDTYIVMAMRNLQVEKKVSVTPAMVRAYYNENPRRFAEESEIHMRVICVEDSPEQAKLTAVQEDLAAGMPFAEAAKLHSTDSKAQEGGDWGIVDLKSLAAPIRDALMPLAVGTYSQPITLNGAHFILYKESAKSAKQPTLEEAWPIAEKQLRQKFETERYRQWMEQLREDAFIKIIQSTES